MTESKDTSPFRNLTMATLPVSEHTVALDGEFMLADNFGLPVDRDAMQGFTASTHPFKMSFTFILFCVSGSMRVRLNLREFSLRAGSVLVVTPGAIGECLAVGDDCRIGIIAFTGTRYFDGIDKGFSMMFSKYLAGNSLIALSHDEMGELVAIYGAMHRKLAQPDFRFKREAMLGYMQVLFCCGYQWMLKYREGNAPAGHKPRQQQLFDRFLDLVAQHYTEQRSISFYAGLMCLTPKYLSAAVRQASGRNAGEWIKDYVVLEAKALLKSRLYTVQQVGDRLHFANASFFAKYFRAATGLSPRQYINE